MSNEHTGIVEQRAADRAKWGYRAYRAPVTAYKTHRITVDLKSGTRTVETVDPSVVPSLSMYAKLVKRDALANATRDMDRIAADRERAKLEAIKASPAAEEMLALRKSRPTLRSLLALAERVTGASYHEILGPRRSQALSWPRHFAFWLVKQNRPDLSLVTIGKAFNRDHTTCLAGLRRVEERRKDEPYASWFAHPEVVSLFGGDR